MSSHQSTTEDADELSGFRADLTALLNRHSREGGSNTPDVILADYLIGCLESFDRSVRERERWYGIASAPGGETEVTR